MPRNAPAAPLVGSPASAISEGGLLYEAFYGPSWARWRAVLKAAHGEPLNHEEDALFREIAERDPPSAKVKELWCIVGRRGGKDSVASAIATVAALGDYRGLLRPGERASVFCLAWNRDQAKIIQRYIAGYFETIPLLRSLVKAQTDDGLELRNGVEIVVVPNNYRAIRGRTVICAVFDEVGFWRDTSSANPDIESYTAIIPALETVPGSMLIGISTPYRRTGLLFDKWRGSYGKNDSDVLVVRGASRLFNPNVRQATIDADMARDPERASAEYLVEWRADLSDFIDRELIDGAVDRGIVVRPPIAKASYIAFADPSGGRGDSFTAAIAHKDGDLAVLDALYERRSPFDPEQTVQEIVELLKSYRLGSITGDKYAAEWVTRAFSRRGVSYRDSERDRSKIYLDALPLFASGRARILDNTRLVHQFVSLERRASRVGRDLVNHPDGGADDLANAAAGAMTLAVERQAMRITDPILEKARQRTSSPWGARREPQTISTFRFGR